MLGHVLDDGYAPEVRNSVTTLTVARFTANAGYRFAVPFLATIASGLGVSLGRLGVGLAVTELLSMSAPFTGRLIERMARRTAMTGGLVGVAAGAAIAGSSRHLVLFVVGLAVLSLSKVFYDVALGAWIADRVPFARRSRVISLTEIAWSTGLLVGVSLLALVVAASSWHVAYFVIAATVLVAAGAVHRRLPHEPAGTQHTHGRTVPVAGAAPTSWATVALVALAVGGLAGSSQFMFVTYGSWLEDHFGFGATGLAAVTFGLGGVELISSIVSVGRTDRWGKERCVLIGTALMVPGAIVVLIGAQHLVPLLVGLAVFLMGFELAIISAMPLGAELTPNAPARGLGTLIGAVTLSRAVVSIPATAWFAAHGMRWSAIGAALLAILAAASIARRPRHRAQPAAPDGRPSLSGSRW